MRRRLMVLMLVAAATAALAAALLSRGPALADARSRPAAGNDARRRMDPLAWSADAPPRGLRAPRGGGPRARHLRQEPRRRLRSARARRVPAAGRRASRSAAPLDADVLEAIVMLESAGRPDAQASNDLAGAVGLTQILAETGRTCSACTSTCARASG